MPSSKPLTKGEKRRAEVLRVARAHLVQNGYDAFSMREVAAEVGTKIGHIQYYFPSRTDLFVALVREEFDHNLNSIQKVMRTANPPKQVLEQVVRALLSDWITDGARVYALMSFLAVHNARFAVLKSDIYAEFHTIIEELICDIRVCPASSQTRTSARLITAVIDGALLQQHPDEQLISAIIANTQRIAEGAS
jgi:AcrR family transcriptional regulator